MLQRRIRNMNKLFIFFMLFAVFYFYHGIKAHFTNFQVKKFEVCNNTQRQIKYFGHVTHDKNNQYLFHNITLPFPVGDNIGSECLIETQIGNTYVDLFNIREQNVCKALNKYLGEFWYDIERQSQIASGVCPFQEGRYHGNHILLHFEKISLQTFPFGKLRFTLEAIDNRSKAILFCLLIEVDNIPN